MKNQDKNRYFYEKMIIFWHIWEKMITRGARMAECQIMLPAGVSEATLCRSVMRRR